MDCSLLDGLHAVQLPVISGDRNDWIENTPRKQISRERDRSSHSFHFSILPDKERGK